MKKFLTALLLTLVPLSIAACGISSSGKSGKSKDAAEISWPKYGPAALLPVPDKLTGELYGDSSDYFACALYDYSEDEAEAYIDKCIEAGFTEDYDRFDGAYYASSTDGYKLSLSYYDRDQEFSIMINAPEDETETEAESETETEAESETETEAESETEADTEVVQDTTVAIAAETEAPSETESSAETVTESSEVTESAVIRPEIKEAIDSYEAFIDEYCEFMKTYDNTDFTMLAEYTKLVGKELEMSEKFSAIADEDLNDAESLYYTEVSLRCSQKLLETSAEIK